MAVKNPCEPDIDLGSATSTGSVGPVCPPGQVRTLVDGVYECVDADSLRNPPEPAPAPPPRSEGANPFATVFNAVQGTPVLPPITPFILQESDEIPRSEDLVVPVPNRDAQYLSATRDLTTINESLFIESPADESDPVPRFAMISHPSLYLARKEDEKVLEQIDNFRLTMQSFWFHSKFRSSEQLFCKPFGDPRLDPEDERSIQNYTVGPWSYGDTLAEIIGTFTDKPMFRINPEFYRKVTHAAPENDNAPERLNFEGFNTVEYIRCEWNAEQLNRMKQFFLNSTGKVMDFFVRGRHSKTYPLLRAQNGGQPLKRFYRTPAIKFSGLLVESDGTREDLGRNALRDFVFDAPVAYHEEELNQILFSRFDSVAIKPTIGNHELRLGLTSELAIPSVYEYYQAKQINKSIDSGNTLIENLPDGLVELNQRTIVGYEADTQTRQSIYSATLNNPALAASEQIINQNLAQAGAELGQSRSDTPLGTGAVSAPIPGNIFVEGDSVYNSSRILKFPSDKIEMLEEINKSIKGSLTNYIEISINTKQGGPINAAFQRNKMDILLLQLFKENPSEYWTDSNPKLSESTKEIARGRFTQEIFGKILDDQLIRRDPNAMDDRGNFLGRTQDRTQNDKESHNITEDVILDPEFLLNLADLHGRSHDLYWPRQLEEYPLFYSGWDKENLLKLEELIRSQIFLGQLEKQIVDADIQRSFADILNGRKAYSEVLGYYVEKYRVVKNVDNQDADVKVQEFIFMDNDSVKKFDFLDTQILPGTKYRYKVFTINFVVGSEYAYYQNKSFNWDARMPGPNGAFADSSEGNEPVNMRVWSNKKLAIIKAPFFEKVVTTVDLPPMTPQVTFLPYQGIDDQYSILVQHSFGQVMERPIAIFGEDFSSIAEMYNDQAITDPLSGVMYKSDSLPTHFEMIRIPDAPEKYTDFDAPDATIVRAEAVGKTKLFRIDKVEPNKNYYYTFRTIDKGGVSNPTEVFRVRMISYENGIIMDMEPYEMYPKPAEFKKSFSRRIKISPNLEQKVVNFDLALEDIASSGKKTALQKLREDLGIRTKVDTKSFQKTAPDIDKLSLGKASGEDSLWDKKFKIRCTSKKTGKKIDLNIVFKKEERK